MTTKLKRKCCVIGCKDRISKRHTLPTNQELRKIWIKNVNNPKLNKEIPETVSKHLYFVCHTHFVDKYRLPKGGLARTAVPTLHLTGDDSEESTTTVTKTEPPNVSIEEVKEDLVEELSILIEEEPIQEEKPEILTETFTGEPVVSAEAPKTPTHSQPSKKAYRSFAELLYLFTKKEISYKLEKEQKNLKNSFKLIPVTTKITVNYDPNSTCRLCLNQTNKLVSVFDKNTINEKELLYKEMIVECASVKIEENDKLPKGICSECIESLNSSYKFRKLCENSEENLNKFLNKFDDNSDQSAKENTSNNNKERKENVNVIEIIEENSLEMVLDSEPNLQIFETEEIIENVNNIEIIEDENYETEPKSQNFNTNEEIVENVNNTELIVEENSETVLESEPKSQTFENEQISQNQQAVVDKKKTIKYFCKVCNINFSRFRLLNTHLKNTHKCLMSYLCKICYKKFPSITKLNEHMKNSKHLKEHFGSLTSKMYNNKVFICKQDMKSRRERLRGQVGEFNCKICDKIYFSKPGLRRHMMNHSKPKISSVCELCHKNFTSPGRLRAHMLTHNRAKKKYICEICGNLYHSSNYLKVHKRIHRGEKPFGCTECSSSFVDRSRLYSHMITHSEEKRYLCSHCGMSFKTGPLLRKHNVVHLTEKPFTCQICLKKFSRKCGLQKHLKSHNFNNEFVCTYCNKGFNRTDYLKIHVMQVHTGERSYICHICGRGFVRRENFRCHLKTHM